MDAGSAFYVDTMLKVPVLHPKDLTYVEQAVLGESLKTMCGIAQADEDPPASELSGPVAESAAPVKPLQEHVKKRRLYRTASGGTMVVCK